MNTQVLHAGGRKLGRQYRGLYVPFGSGQVGSQGQERLARMSREPANRKLVQPTRLANDPQGLSGGLSEAESGIQDYPFWSNACAGKNIEFACAPG